MNENKSRFLSVWRQSHIPTSSSSRRKSIILLRQHKEKGSMNSNMGQCIKDSTHRENRYDCVAVVVVFTFHKTASISSIDRAQTGGTEWAHAVNILSKCQRFWSHWRNATSFICVAFDTRMCAERWVLPLFSVFFSLSFNEMFGARIQTRTQMHMASGNVFRVYKSTLEIAFMLVARSSTALGESIGAGIRHCINEKILSFQTGR